jgi:hypothetical protein
MGSCVAHVSAQITVAFPGGQHQLLCHLTRNEAQLLARRRPGAGEVADFVFRRLGELEAPGGPLEGQHIPKIALGWRVEFVDHLDILQRVHETKRPTAADMHRCQSLLEVGQRLLPARIREETLDEWVDELETAAEKGRAIWRRTFSILFRALPSIACRSRLSLHGRRGSN